jgi:hypothetical protein
MMATARKNATEGLTCSKIRQELNSNSHTNSSSNSQLPNVTGGGVKWGIDIQQVSDSPLTQISSPSGASALTKNPLVQGKAGLVPGNS